MGHFFTTSGGSGSLDSQRDKSLPHSGACKSRGPSRLLSLAFWGREFPVAGRGCRVPPKSHREVRDKEQEECILAPQSKHLEMEAATSMLIRELG